MRNLLICLILTGPAAAQDALSGDAFESFVTGKTLGYSVGVNTPYGTERYMENRQVIWTTIDGRCTTGFWYENDTQICFRYEDLEGDKCWHFFPQNEDLVGVFQEELGKAYRVRIIDDKDLFACNKFTS